MTRHPLALALATLGLLCALAAHAAEFAWLEAEDTSSINVKPSVVGWGHTEFLSGGKWLHLSIDAEQVTKTVPAEGVLLKYAFNLGKDAGYEIWDRVGFEFIRSAFDWRVDDGPWVTAKPDDLTCDLMELDVWCEVAWLKLGERQLAAGPHTLQIRLPITKDDQGKTNRILYASDVLCIHEGPFHPYSKFRPDEDWRTQADRDAEQNVFTLPEAQGAARSSASLAGPWEVCRNDEQMPGEVAAPIQDMPAEPKWTAIPVPGDKNTQRPDLLLCHRLWYRTRLNVPDSQAGRSFFVAFPQNNLNTTVLVNGTYCGFDKNPFARVQVDVTKAIKPGVNELWVGIKDAWYGRTANPKKPLKLRRTFNVPPTYFGSGWQDLAYPIWNHAESGILVAPQFVAAGPVYAADVFCKPSVARKEMAAEVTLANSGGQAVSGELRWEAVSDKTGRVEKTFKPQPFSLGPGATPTLQIAGAWDNPKLWWPDDPNLYRLRTTLVVNGRPADVAETPFGFREWSWAGHDFKLNGLIWHGWADCFGAPDKEQWLALYHQYHETMMRFWGTGWQGMTPDDAFTFFDHTGVVVRRTGMLDGEGIGSYPWETDPDLKAERGTDLKVDLADNWRDQCLAQVRGERNHPSIMIWSLENEFMYISCLNMGWAERWEPTETRVAQAVMALDPTRPVMVDGGGALKDQTLPVHGDHYVVGPPQEYPDLAYQTNPAGGGRGRWVWDEKRPRFLGEDFYMTGNHPEVSYFQGEGAFAGKPVAGVGLWERILHEGYRWAGYGAWHLWLGQGDTDQSQYNSLSPRAALCRQWNWTFESGQKVKRTFGVFNDTRYDEPITFTWALSQGARRLAGRSQELAVAPGCNVKLEEELPMPVITTARQEAELTLTLKVKGQEVFRDVKAVSVLRPGGAPGSKLPLPGLTAANLLVFDPQGAVRAFLKARNIPFTAQESLATLPAEGRALIIGKDALDARESTSSHLAAYALGGRRLLILEQKNPLRYQGLPAEMSPATNLGSTAFGEDLDHPALRGLQQKDFFTWGVDTPVYRDAYAKPNRGAKSLVQCDDNLRYTSLVEVPVGQGLMLLSQLQVASNLDTNPVAKQLLLNLVSYAASYKLQFNQVVAALDDNPQVARALDAMGLQYTKVQGPLAALDAAKAKVAVVSASPANLKILAENLARVKAYNAAGGSLVLCGLTPEGLDSYNQIVGVDHMIRPGKRERINFPPVRDRLMSGLTTGDVVLFSSQRIFSWTEGNYVVSDMFTYVVDYDEVASFGTSPFFAYDNITNGFVSADGWPLIINFPINKDNSAYDIPITLQKPQAITEFTWIGNVMYYPQNRVSLLFDGPPADKLSWKVQPNAEPQTFAVDPPRRAKTVTLEINEWTAKPNTAPNIGIDNIYLKAQRPPEFYRDVRQMLSVGGLMHYVKGPGNIVLCNLNFKDSEDVPENAIKKRNILAAILRNLQAPFSGGRPLIAGADLKYTPLDLSRQANQYRGERGWFGDAAHTFKDLPTGLHTFAGVPYNVFAFATSPVFDCVMLGGPGVPNSPPQEVKGIPVNRKADALFFLHAARLDAWRDAREVQENKKYEMLRYVVHYADGQTVTVPIYAELDISDYRQKTPTGLPGAQLAWTKPYEGPELNAVAYSKQWNNPRPEVEITSVDMTYGPDRRGVPALLALTAAAAGQ